MDRVLVIILAGGVGERLKPLTTVRSKAAVPFGGKYRLIDIALSNCICSALRQIFVLTQYRSESLHRHIQDGWAIPTSGFGDFIYCVPPQFRTGEDWYHGTADAVRQNIHLFNTKDFDDVLILSGDHVYKMDYSQLIAYHRSKKAGITISAIRARKEQAAGRLGVLEIDHDYRLISFEEKPADPKTIPDAADYALASMGIYVFKADTLFQSLQGQEEDFGRHIIPGLLNSLRDISIYDYEKENKISDFEIVVTDGIRDKILVDRTSDSSYWRDVGTIDSYYEASMDLVGVDPIFNLYGEKWNFRTCPRHMPPSKFLLGARINNSIISDGCIISGGAIWDSILSPGVIVERDAVIEQSVVFNNVLIEPGARIKQAIIDDGTIIRSGASIGYDREADTSRGCTISDSGITVVPKDKDIK